MGFFDKFLDAIKLNDDFDDDDYLDGDDYDDDEEDDLDEEFEKPKTKKRFFSKFKSDEDDLDDEDDFEDDDFDDEPVKSRKKTPSKISAAKTSTVRRQTSRDISYEKPETSVSSRRAASSKTTSAKRSSYQDTQPSSDYRTSRRQKVTPIRRKSTGTGSGMEVSVIRPSSMEDTREIADTLMNSCTVILNLEGLDVDIAQRVIDFSCGVCYSLEGKLQKVASYIFILTPADVDISGDFQSILTGAFDLSSMQSSY